MRRIQRRLRRRRRQRQRCRRQQRSHVSYYLLLNSSFTSPLRIQQRRIQQNPIRSRRVSFFVVVHQCAYPWLTTISSTLAMNSTSTLAIGNGTTTKTTALSTTGNGTTSNTTALSTTNSISEFTNSTGCDYCFKLWRFCSSCGFVLVCSCWYEHDSERWQRR